MKIRFTTIAAGPRLSAQPGQIRDLPPEVARDLVAGGFAVEVDPDPEVAPVAAESAAVAPAEAAVTTPVRPRRGSPRQSAPVPPAGA